jgi:hypothetical protein
MTGLRPYSQLCAHRSFRSGSQRVFATSEIGANPSLSKSTSREGYSARHTPLLTRLCRTALSDAGGMHARADYRNSQRFNIGDLNTPQSLGG